MTETWRRHDLLRVRPGAWLRVLRQRPGLETVPHVASWAEQGWPLIVRRRSPGEAPGTIPVGMPLPPALGKQRIALQVRAEDLGGRLPPETLRAAHAEVPPAWRGAVDTLLTLAERIGAEPRVFGSLLWQRRTGLPYLTVTSDLDLLWPVDDADGALRLARALAAAEAKLGPVRLDGEILLPDGGGVQWRELHRAGDKVLVKTLTGVELRPVTHLGAATLQPA